MWSTPHKHWPTKGSIWPMSTEFRQFWKSRNRKKFADSRQHLVDLGPRSAEFARCQHGSKSLDLGGCRAELGRNRASTRPKSPKFRRSWAKVDQNQSKFGQYRQNWAEFSPTPANTGMDSADTVQSRPKSAEVGRTQPETGRNRNRQSSALHAPPTSKQVCHHNGLFQHTASAASCPARPYVLLLRLIYFSLGGAPADVLA